MAYLSNRGDQNFLGGFSCGSECGCRSCRTSVDGLEEWYQKEEEDEAPATPPPRTAPPAAPPPPRPAAGHPPGMSGWSGSRFGCYGPGGLGFFSQAAAPARLVYPQINTQLPASGPGYYTYYAADRRGRPDSPPGYHRYGTPELIRAIQAIAAEWNRLHPRGPRLGIGDLSLIGGGPTPRHGAHQRGLEFDIRPPRSDAREMPATHRDPNYSLSLTQELVNVIRANPVLRVRVVLFNDTGVRGVQSFAGHDNHLHVGFLAPAGAGGPVRAGQAVGPSGPRTRPTGRGPSSGIRTQPTGRGPSSGIRTQPTSGPPDIIRRTNEIFFARHPERRGRPIGAGEQQLAREWAAIREGLLRGGR